MLRHFDRQFRVEFQWIVDRNRSRVGVDREIYIQCPDFLRNLLRYFDCQFRVQYHYVVDRSRSRIGIDRESGI